MVKLKDNDIEIQRDNQNKLRKIEQFYNTNIVDTMFEDIEKKKEELIEKMIEYKNKHLIPCKWDREGNELDYDVDISPIVINNYFFKSIVPIASQEPMYNAEKLGMVFDYYCDILAEVNDKIGNFPPSLTSFCKLSGITTATLRNYKNSDDYSMRVVANKIYDQIGDDNITMGQMGIVKERTTLFKLKSQNEMVEKVQPNVNINLNQGMTEEDMKRIEEKLSRYKNFANKKER